MCTSWKYAHSNNTHAQNTRIADHNENDLEGKFSLYRQPENVPFSFLRLLVCVCVFDLALYVFGSSSV